MQHGERRAYGGSPSSAFARASAVKLAVLDAAEAGRIAFRPSHAFYEGRAGAEGKEVSRLKCSGLSRAAPGRDCEARRACAAAVSTLPRYCPLRFVDVADRIVVFGRGAGGGGWHGSAAEALASGDRALRKTEPKPFLRGTTTVLELGRDWRSRRFTRRKPSLIHVRSTIYFLMLDVRLSRKAGNAAAPLIKQIRSRVSPA
jgi:hypothetical protein